eukprot:TRINITY_DN6184_c0_g1_i1.p1 TRINITY_DN6184_c0_g1~~TRINITY_DN6184_c0_g1_i1.p1  ORF type:complete len:312 (-),score=46.28 TRINITY_DN6184_c0_g1_i1:188-1123(-)
MAMTFRSSRLALHATRLSGALERTACSSSLEEAAQKEFMKQMPLTPPMGNSQAVISMDFVRGFCSTILAPKIEQLISPSELIKGQELFASKRVQGKYEDIVQSVVSLKNEHKGSIVLAGDVFDVPIRKDIVHRVVCWQLAKRRRGTHCTKGISQVSGTGRKPWPQKGTGRARHGTLRGPQFRHGATAHGPKPRSYAYKLQKKVRRLGLKIALSARAAEGKLVILDKLKFDLHKTRYVASYLKQFERCKKFLFVDGGPVCTKFARATQNIPHANVLPSIGLNVYSILLHDTLVMTEDAVNRIVERMHTPIKR